MKKLLVLLSLVCSLSLAKAQDFGFDLFIMHLEVTDRNPTPVEFVGLSLMSVGGCMVGVDAAYPQMQRRERGYTVSLSGTALLVTGFVTYLVGSIRFNEREVKMSKVTNI